MELRQPVETVGFVDEYCLLYRSVFGDVRSYECFKYLHVGILSSLPRKTLPEIAKLAGLKDGQGLHHFLRDGVWSVEQVRAIRLHLIRQQIGTRVISLCIDETGDVKKGSATDYAAKQYIGNLGKTANGVVSVNAYAVVDGITYPLLFKIYKPKSRLKTGDEYKSKLQLAIEIIREIQAMGFVIEQVLADSLYGESSDVTGVLHQLKLPYIVAIRSNHGVLMPKGQRVRYNRWRAYDQPLAEQPTQRRYINELGWHDYRLTDYASMERWWELIFSAYLLVSFHAEEFKHHQQSQGNHAPPSPTHPLPFSQHCDWELGTTWKSALNNLRLLLQPYWCWGWLEQWLRVFPVPGLKRALHQLMDWMDTFKILPTLELKVV